MSPTLSSGPAPADREFLERHAAFGLEADIDERDVVLDRDDAALDDGAFEAGGTPSDSSSSAAKFSSLPDCG